ncbi:MAG: DsbA family oxidoreductase [Chryseolinea sp.]
MKKMQIEVWSDIMCPFCYIGKRNMEKALSKFEYAHNVEIEWKSFQLNPNLPMGNGTKQNAYEYLAKHKGISYQESVQMHKNVSKVASEAGLTYNFDKTLIANSFNAHRVLQLAKSKGIGDKAEELLFHSYFTEGKDISDTQTLYDLGGVLGFSKDDIDQALNLEIFEQGVKSDIAEARKLAVNGVPFFAFNRKYAISGAQQPEIFLEVLEKSFAEWRADNPIPAMQTFDGQVCTSDGGCN